jgi:hypothetical protein
MEVVKSFNLEVSYALGIHDYSVSSLWLMGLIGRVGGGLIHILLLLGQ